MRFRAPQFTVDPEEPFKHDLLDRRESAGYLTNLLMHTEDPLVISIDGAWGAGKTTFLLMWKQYLELNGFPIIYFSAWENDFSDNALVTLLGELDTGIGRLKKGKKGQAQLYEKLETLKDLGTRLAKKSLPVAVRVASAGVLDLESEIEAALSSLSESVVREEIGRYEKSKSTITSFRSRLAKLAGQLSANREGGEHRPLVILIDELNRCHPNFAVELLEKAKHFFSVPNIVFVLAVDKRQLGCSLEAVYGQGIEVSGYLRRFIDLDYLLPKPKPNAFIESLFDKFELDQKFRERQATELRFDRENFLGVFTALFTSLALPLRTQEQCMAQVGVALLTTPNNVRLYPLLFGTLLCIKAAKRDLYEAFISRQSSAAGLIEYLRTFQGLKAFLEEPYGIAVELYIEMSVEDQFGSHDFADKLEQLSRDEREPEHARERAKKKSELIRTGQLRGAWGCLDHVVKRIEMSSHFSVTYESK